MRKPSSRSEKQVFELAVLTFNDILGVLHRCGFWPVPKKDRRYIAEKILKLRTFWNINLAASRRGFDSFYEWADFTYSQKYVSDLFEQAGATPFYGFLKTVVSDEDVRAIFTDLVSGGDSPSARRIREFFY